MDFTLRILGAFDTLAEPTVTEAALRAELQARGETPEDSELTLDKAVREGLLVRTPEGRLARAVADEPVRNDVSQTAGGTP